jgi:hypothetical protein
MRTYHRLASLLFSTSGITSKHGTDGTHMMLQQHTDAYRVNPFEHDKYEVQTLIICIAVKHHSMSLF